VRQQGFRRFSEIVARRRRWHSGSSRISGAASGSRARAARLVQSFRAGRGRPDRIETQLGAARFDVEGRLAIAHFGRLAVATVYFPKGSGTDRDNSRVPYKLAFYRALFERLQTLRRRGPVFVIGDYNTAHTELDLAHPKNNAKTSGFLPEERAELSRWLDAGWVDTFRARHPGGSGHYTWWRQWGGAREKNVGWRIDYVLASPSAAKRVIDAFIWPDVLGSDHCPVGVDVEE
jgi:exodeoxyribonuclease-3